MDIVSDYMFGRYRLAGIMASGGMARLYLAVMEGVDGFSRVVSLKQVLPHLAQSSEFTEMFLNEARLAAKLDHPNIVRIYDLGEIDGQYYLSMEYLPGEDLTRILSKSRKLRQWIPVPVAASVVQSTADALQFAHELVDESGKPLGLVHRDVSLSNVIVTYHGTAKLADFGIAKATAAAGDMGTRAGVFKGKFAYAAPEQVLGKEVDARTDVFSLGIVLWELLTVRRLFKRENEAATIRAVEKADVPSLRSVRPDIPQELDNIAMKALARRRRDRFQSAAEMSDALDEVLGTASARATAKQLSKWLEGLFGTETANVKKAIAQGRGLDQRTSDNKLVIPAEDAKLLGLKPVPEGAARRASDTAPSRPENAAGPIHVNVPASPAPNASAPPPVPSPSAPVFTASPPKPAARASTIPRAAWSTDPEFVGATASGGSVGGSTGGSGGSGGHISAAGLPFAEGSASWSNLPGVPFNTVSAASETHAGSGSGSGQLEIGQHLERRELGRRGLIAGALLGVAVAGVVVVVALSQKGASSQSSVAAGPQATAHKGQLRVSSDPPGASISIDGKPSGFVSPAVMRNLPTDRPIQLRVEKDSYAPEEQELQLEASRPTDKVIKLRRLGVVRLMRVPRGARVLVGGKQVNASQPLSLPAGSHELRVERDGEVLESRAIEVRPGGDQLIELGG